MRRIQADVVAIELESPKLQPFFMPTGIRLLPITTTHAKGPTGNMVCYDGANYENAAKNNAEKLRYIREAMERLKKYCDALDGSPDQCGR